MVCVSNYLTKSAPISSVPPSFINDGTYGLKLNNGDVTMKKLILCSVLALTACGGGGGSSEKALSKVESLAGVWDDSEDFGRLGIDESYFTLDKDGYISTYDFAGDTFDEWGNCYWIEEKLGQITHLSGDKYSFKDSETAKVTEIELIYSNQILTIKQPDTEDSDEDGNTTEMTAFEAKRSSKTVASFTPKCADTMSQARTIIPAKSPKSSPLDPQ
jgi:hypothetical protein